MKFILRCDFPFSLSVSHVAGEAHIRAIQAFLDIFHGEPTDNPDRQFSRAWRLGLATSGTEKSADES